MHVLIEFIAGPLPMHHAPTFQLVGGALGRLAIARALCTLDQWLRTLYTTALSWRHFPPQGNRLRDILAIFYKAMRVTHTPSFLVVHTLFLPTIDTVLLPAGVDLSPVLFGTQAPAQFPTWIQFGFVVRQIVHHLKEQMQSRGLYWDASHTPSASPAPGIYEMPLILQRVLTTLMVLTEFAFRQNRLQLYWLFQDIQLIKCQKQIFHYARIATLSATIFRSSTEWKPYERHSLLQVAALLRFSQRWPAAGSKTARVSSRAPKIATGAALPRQALVLIDQLGWHGKACPIGLFLMDALDGMSSVNWTDHISLYDCAAWHTPSAANQASMVFAHLHDAIQQLLRRPSHATQLDLAAMSRIIGHAPEHLDGWPHHPPASAHGLYSSARIALIVALAQPSIFETHIGVRRGQDPIEYVSHIASHLYHMCAEIVKNVDAAQHGGPRDAATGTPVSAWGAQGIPAITHHMPWITPPRVHLALSNALADRFSRATYHPGHTSSVHIYRLLHGRVLRDASLVIPRPVMNEVMISSLPRLRIHTRARRIHIMPVSCTYLEGPLLAFVQLGNSVFSMGILITSLRYCLTERQPYLCLHRQIHKALQMALAAGRKWVAQETHGDVTMIVDNHVLEQGRRGCFIAHPHQETVAHAHIGHSCRIYVVGRP